METFKNKTPLSKTFMFGIVIIMLCNSATGQSETGDVFRAVKNNTGKKFMAVVHKLKEEYSKALSDLKAELMDEQNLMIKKLEEELNEVKGLLAETNCTEARNSVAKDLNVLQAQLGAIDVKPRFAAEIRPLSIYYLPSGDIKDYTELIDANDNFNPKTGVFWLNNDSENGVYEFHVSGLKSGFYGHNGLIYVYKNNDYIQSIYEQNANHYHMMSAVFTLYLQRGDKVELKNEYKNSIHVESIHPFTFTGYKILDRLS